MTVLIIGGSRGIGAALVRDLNARGVAGLFTYCSGVDRAARIREQCQLWSSIHLDLTRMTREVFSRSLEEIGREVTTIIVASAAGLRPTTDRGYAMSVNALGPARLISRIDDLNKCAYGVIYLTSPAAHHFQTGASHPADIYRLVAETKNAGEGLMHRLSSRWLKCRSASAVVCELVKPSTAYVLFRRLEPQTVEGLESSGQIVDQGALTAWLSGHIEAVENGHALDPVMEFRPHEP